MQQHHKDNKNIILRTTTTPTSYIEQQQQQQHHTSNNNNNINIIHRTTTKTTSYIIHRTKTTTTKTTTTKQQQQQHHTSNNNSLKRGSIFFSDRTYHSLSQRPAISANCSPGIRSSQTNLNLTFNEKMHHLLKLRAFLFNPTVSFRDLDRRYRDNYFWVDFDHFWRELHFLRQLGQHQKLARS